MDSVFFSPLGNKVVIESDWWKDVLTYAIPLINIGAIIWIYLQQKNFQKNIASFERASTWFKHIFFEPNRSLIEDFFLKCESICRLTLTRIQELTSTGSITNVDIIGVVQSSFVSEFNLYSSALRVKFVDLLPLLDVELAEQIRDCLNHLQEGISDQYSKLIHNRDFDMAPFVSIIGTYRVEFYGYLLKYDKDSLPS